MTRLILSSAVLGLVLGLGGTASAYDWFSGQQADVYATSNLPLVNIGGCDCGGGNDCGCNGGCDSCGNVCCCGGAWIADFEATFLRYHRGANFDQDNMLDFGFAPRVTLGYQSCDGLGVRVRWWEYDHNGERGVINNIANRQINVDTFNLDFEVYQSVQLAPYATVEFSGGIRYNDFQEDFFTGAALTQQDLFNAYGGIFGLKVRTMIGPGTLYGRWNASILMDDWLSIGRGREFDVAKTQTELGIGYEFNRVLNNGALLTLRAGGEWSNWSNYVNERFAGTIVDVGFGGFVLGGGIQY